MSNTQCGFSQKHYFQNYVYPERSILEPFKIQSAYLVGDGKYLVNNHLYIDKKQGRMVGEGNQPRIFIPLHLATSSQIQRLCNWSEPFKIEGSAKKGREYFKNAVHGGLDLLRLDIYNISLNSTDTTKFQFTSPYYYLTSNQLKNKIYAMAGSQFSSVIDAYLGILAQRYLRALSIVGIVYVVPTDILEDIVQEVCEHILNCVY